MHFLAGDDATFRFAMREYGDGVRIQVAETGLEKRVISVQMSPDPLGKKPLCQAFFEDVGLWAFSWALGAALSERSVDVV